MAVLLYQPKRAALKEEVEESVGTLVNDVELPRQNPSLAAVLAEENGFHLEGNLTVFHLSILSSSCRLGR
jgi:hypothetical protein